MIFFERLGQAFLALAILLGLGVLVPSLTGPTILLSALTAAFVSLVCLLVSGLLAPDLGPPF